MLTLKKDGFERLALGSPDVAVAANELPQLINAATEMLGCRLEGDVPFHHEKPRRWTGR